MIDPELIALYAETEHNTHQTSLLSENNNEETGGISGSGGDVASEVSTAADLKSQKKTTKTDSTGSSAHPSSSSSATGKPSPAQVAASSGGPPLVSASSKNTQKLKRKDGTSSSIASEKKILNLKQNNGVPTASPSHQQLQNMKPPTSPPSSASLPNLEIIEPTASVIVSPPPLAANRRHSLHNAIQRFPSTSSSSSSPLSTSPLTNLVNLKISTPPPPLPTGGTSTLSTSPTPPPPPPAPSSHPYSSSIHSASFASLYSDAHSPRTISPTLSHSAIDFYPPNSSSSSDDEHQHAAYLASLLNRAAVANSSRRSSLGSSDGEREVRRSTSVVSSSLNDVLSGSASTSGDIFTAEYASKRRNDEFHEFFPDIDIDEILVQDYSCALQRDILIQGRLYISEHHVQFYAKIFGWVHHVVIPISQIHWLEKRNVAGIIPNSIEICLKDGSKYFLASFINRDTPFEIIQLLRKSPPTKKVIKLRTIRKQPQQLQQQSEMSGRASILSSDGGQSSSLRSEPQSDADDEQGAESTASIEDGRGGSVENIAIATTTGEDVKNLSDPEEDRVFSRLNKSMSLECDVPTAGLIDRAKLQRDLAEIEEIRSVTSASTSKADSPFLTAPSDQAVAVLATASQQHPTLLVSTSSEAAPITSSPVQETAPILSISNISSTSSSSAPASSAPTSKPSTTATSSPSRSPSKQSEENFFTSAFKKMNNLFQQPAAAAANSVPVSADSLASLNSSLSKNIPPSKTTLNTLSTSSTSMLPSSLSSSTTVAKASSKEDTTPSHTKKSSKHHHKKNKSTASVASFESNSSAGAGDSSDASPASNNQQPSLVISQKTKSKTHSSKKVAGSSSSSSASSTTAAAAVSKKQVTSPVMQSTEAIAGVHSSSGSKLLAAVGVAGDSGNNTTVSSKSATLLTSILDSNNSKSKKANTIGGSKLSSTAADPSIPTTTTTSALSGLAELAAAGSSLSLSRHSTPPPQLLGSEGVGPSTVASSPSQPHILVQGVLVAPVTAKELAQMPRGTGLGSRSDLSTTTDIGRRKSEKTSTSSRGQTKIPVATLLPPPSLPLCQCTSAQAVASMTCIMDTVFEGVTVNTLWGELFAYSACLAGDRSIGQESLFRLFLIETRKSKDLVVTPWRNSGEHDAVSGGEPAAMLSADKEMSTLHTGMTRDMEYITQVNNPIGPKTTLVKTRQTIVHTFPATTYYLNNKNVDGSVSELRPRIVPSYLHGICVSAVSESPEAPAGGCFRTHSITCLSTASSSSSASTSTRMKVYCRVEFHKSSWLRLAVEKAVPDAMKGYHADLAIEIRKWVDTRRGLFGVDLDEVDEGLVAASGGGGDTVSILSGSDGLRSEHSSIKSSSPLPDAHDPGSSKSTVSGNTVTAAAVQEITSSNERVLVTEEQALQALIVLIRYVGVSRALASLFISLFLISASINVAIVVWMMY